MKYCPQCNRQFTDAWLTFCTEDGSLLIEELSPARDPNWDPRIRNPNLEDPSERTTQRQPPSAGAWIAPDERTPPPAPAWQPPPPRPNVKPAIQGITIASLVAGIVGLLFGWFCAGPIPGIIALVLGFSALAQIRKSPERAGEKPIAMIGIILGAINVMFFVLWLVWFIVSLVFG
jgi:hypothetical protein